MGLIIVYLILVFVVLLVLTRLVSLGNFDTNEILAVVLYTAYLIALAWLMHSHISQMGPLLTLQLKKSPLVFLAVGRALASAGIIFCLSASAISMLLIVRSLFTGEPIRLSVLSWLWVLLVAGSALGGLGVLLGEILLRL